MHAHTGYTILARITPSYIFMHFEHMNSYVQWIYTFKTVRMYPPSNVSMHFERTI